MLIINRSHVKSSRTELISETSYFDIETDLLFVNTDSYQWMDDEELNIDGTCFDVLKVDDLGNGKTRVFVYQDNFEAGLSKTFKDHELHKNSQGKKHNTFSDLLKLKTYTKHSSLNTPLCAQDLIFGSLSMNTEEGHFTLPYHPPTV